VIGDESYFDSRRGEPASNYAIDPNLVGALSALAFNRGLSGSFGSPPAYAASAGRHAAPRRRRRHRPLARRRRRPVRRALLVTHRLAADGDAGEAHRAALGRLLRGDAAQGARRALRRRRHDRGRSGGRLAVPRDAAPDPAIVDGSGLSRADRTTPLDVVTLLRDLSPGGISSLQAIGADAARGAAGGQRDGTLEFRMPHSAASGHCMAKTGTLSDASDLAGWCNGIFAFAFLMNHVDVTAAQDAQDTMTIALAKLSVPAARAGRLVEHRDAEPLRLLELRAGAVAGDDVVGLLRDRARHAAAGGLDQLGRLPRA
jgi:D-alanyl-D-alanine carboxypeptidase/D-alanyl-D-alanine-endopeptidase (penicillin-binding protein 4)